MVLYAPDYTKLGSSHHNVRIRGMCGLVNCPPGVDGTIAGLDSRIVFGVAGQILDVFAAGCATRSYAGIL